MYARTFAHAHAPTRFFPAALALNDDQLVALQVHEGLHRALPEAVREQEAVVANLTLAITSPEATHDQIRRTMSTQVSETDLAMTQYSVPASAPPNVSPSETKGETSGHFKQPSSLAYTFRQFANPEGPTRFAIPRMHLLQSDLYPFGGKNTPFGMGIQGSFIQGPTLTEMGPLALSAKLRVWSARDFAIGIFAQASLNVLSADELKNSPFGRDVYTVGISLKKEMDLFYVENYLSYDFKGTSKQTVGAVSYEYDYGGVIDAKVRAGLRIWKFDLGAFGELHLADYFRVSGGAYERDFGRYRIVSAGPEFTFATKDYALSLTGRFLLDATKGANFDYLGNLMGPGVSQGSVSATARVFF